MITNITPANTINVAPQTMFKSSANVDKREDVSSSNAIRNALLALAMIGMTTINSSCSKGDFEEDFERYPNTEIIGNNSISTDCLYEYNDINEKTNFIFHQLGIIDEDKRINDIAELSFTDGKGEKYVLNVVGECPGGPEFSGTVEGADGVKRYAKMRLFQGNELIEKQVGISTWYNKTHSDSYIKQVGWEIVNGEPKAVFHEFRPATNSSERGKYGEYTYNKDNEFEIIRTADGIISRPIVGRNPATGMDMISDISVKYKTGDEQEEPTVVVVDPSDITTTVTYDYQP